MTLLSKSFVGKGPLLESYAIIGSQSQMILNKLVHNLAIFKHPPQLVPFLLGVGGEYPL